MLYEEGIFENYRCDFGFYCFSKVNEFIDLNKSYDPDPRTKEVYNELFKSYKNVYSGLRKAFIKANRIRFNESENQRN